MPFRTPAIPTAPARNTRRQRPLQRRVWSISQFAIRRGIGAQNQQLALPLNFAGDFDPGKYKDSYRDKLCEIIRAKRSGKDVHHAAEVEEEAPPDLLEALRASIEAAAGRRGRSRASRDGRSRDLAGLSKAELDERARKANIRGRSKMSKDELIEALRAA